MIKLVKFILQSFHIIITYIIILEMFILLCLIKQKQIIG